MKQLTASKLCFVPSENRDSYATKRLPSFDTTIKGLKISNKNKVKYNVVDMKSFQIPLLLVH